MNAALASPLSEVAANAGWLAASQVLRRLLRLCVLVLIARMLGMESFGIYALLLTLVELIGLITGFSYGDFLTREIAKDSKAAWPLAKRISQIRFAYTVPCVALALLVLAALRFPASLIGNAALLSLMLVPRVIGDSAQGVMKALRRFRPLLWVELGQGTMMLATAPLLILQGFGLKGVIAAEILVSLIGAMIAVLAIAPSVDFRATNHAGLRELVGSTLPFNIYPFIATIYDRVDVVLLSKLAGNIATAIYSVPYRIFASFSIIPYGVMGALLPVFSASEVNRETRQDCARAMKVLYLISLQFVLLAFAFARPAILMVLGQGYSESVVTIEILSWASIPVFQNHALNILLLAARKEKIFIWTASVCTVFNISANLLLIPRFSFIGAAVATLLTEVLLLGQNCYLSRRLLGELVLPKDAFKVTLVFLLIFSSFFLLRNHIGELLAGALTSGTFAALAIRNVGLRALIQPRQQGYSM